MGIYAGSSAFPAVARSQPYHRVGCFFVNSCRATGNDNGPNPFAHVIIPLLLTDSSHSNTAEESSGVFVWRKERPLHLWWLLG